ncbi:hypothetical protein H6F90_29820 [Trichocoleus sp. FACHB-591]|uniref:hypothetical protein n=1 Tax=Trichocoleus sp. FACHB-591 TaxID=2692872 RepID=UPI001682023C|nr:hypothetical protein [Trichocoleus sp. FACHB-591]MBD2099265.1 hypothetical protein [Trichocoleus sp. FACHB-591]
MNRTIASKFISFLPIAGMAILVFSLFMQWFSCGFSPEEIIFRSSYIDLFKESKLKGSNLTFHYLEFLCLSLATCFLFASYFSNKTSINKYFVLFLVMLFPTVLLSMLQAWFLDGIGYHSTITYPCSLEPGFRLYIFGLVVILIGSCFRARRNA